MSDLSQNNCSDTGTETTSPKFCSECGAPLEEHSEEDQPGDPGTGWEYLSLAGNFKTRSDDAEETRARIQRKADKMDWFLMKTLPGSIIMAVLLILLVILFAEYLL